MSTQNFDLPSLVGGPQNTTYPGQTGLLKELIGQTLPRSDGFNQQMESNLTYFQKKLRRASRDVADAVQVDPTVMHGNPVFSGTRIPLYQIVEELADGTSFDELIEGYPSLHSDQIRRGLDFVASLLRIYDEEVSN
jgi:uncharacterized protein (DUF433 family)